MIRIDRDRSVEWMLNKLCLALLIITLPKSFCNVCLQLSLVSLDYRLRRAYNFVPFAALPFLRIVIYIARCGFYIVCCCSSDCLCTSSVGKYLLHYDSFIAVASLTRLNISLFFRFFSRPAIFSFAIFHIFRCFISPR